MINLRLEVICDQCGRTEVIEEKKIAIFDSPDIDDMIFREGWVYTTESIATEQVDEEIEHVYCSHECCEAWDSEHFRKEEKQER
jgi:hypothetical protein